MHHAGWMRLILVLLSTFLMGCVGPAPSPAAQPTALPLSTLRPTLAPTGTPPVPDLAATTVLSPPLTYPDEQIAVVRFSPQYATDQTLFVGSTHGLIYRTTSAGARWTRLDPTSASLHTLPTDASCAVANPSLRPHIYELILSPTYATDQTLFAAALLSTNNNWLQVRVYRSTDAGQHWTAQDLLSWCMFERPNSIELLASPTYTQDQTLFAVLNLTGDSNSPSSVIVRSSDGGRTWLVAEPLEPNWNSACPGVTNSVALSPHYAQDKTLIVACDDNPNGEGAVRSTDGGHTWTPLGIAGPVRQVLSPAYDNDQTVFLITDRLLRSIDGGFTLSALPAPIAPDVFALSPDYRRDQTLFLGTAGQFARSTDGGATWTTSSTPYVVEKLTFSPNYRQDQTLLAIVREPGQQGSEQHHLLRSQDRGLTWTLGSPNIGTEAEGPVELVVSPTYAVDQTLIIRSAYAEWRQLRLLSFH